MPGPGRAVNTQPIEVQSSHGKGKGWVGCMDARPAHGEIQRRTWKSNDGCIGDLRYKLDDSKWKYFSGTVVSWGRKDQPATLEDALSQQMPNMKDGNGNRIFGEVEVEKPVKFKKTPLVKNLRKLGYEIPKDAGSEDKWKIEEKLFVDGYHTFDFTYDNPSSSGTLPTRNSPMITPELELISLFSAMIIVAVLWTAWIANKWSCKRCRERGGKVRTVEEEQSGTDVVINPSSRPRIKSRAKTPNRNSHFDV